jgi:hypothetical protein
MVAFFEKQQVLKFIKDRGLYKDVDKNLKQVEAAFPGSTLTLALQQIPESGDFILLLFVERPSYVRKEREVLDSIFGYSEDFNYQITNIAPSSATNRNYRCFNNDVVKKMRELPEGWSIEGAAKPNDLSIKNTNDVLEWIKKQIHIEPISVEPSIEEGMMIRFHKDMFDAYIECYNDGEIGYTIARQGRCIVSHDICNEGINTDIFYSDLKQYLQSSFVDTKVTDSKGLVEVSNEELLETASRMIQEHQNTLNLLAANQKTT